MKRLLKLIPVNGEFAKNAIILTIGTSIAQAFPIIFYPILGRMFPPSEFGLLAILTSLTSILASISTGKYEGSILIANSKKEAANIIGLILILSSVILLIAFILFQIFSNQLSILMNVPNLKKWLFIPSLSGFLIVIYACYNEWCVRNKYFINLSFNKIINASSTTLSKFFFGLIKLINGGLILGDLLGRIISASGCIFRALKKDKEVFLHISFNHVKKVAKKYVNFPKLYLPGQLLNTIGGQMPVLLIGIFFNSTEVGFFSMTMNVLSIPISVISSAINDTFRQKANEDYIKKGQCRSIYIKMLKILSIFSLTSSIILYFILPKLFRIVLGSQWAKAGEYSQIILLMIAFSFISNSLGSVLIIAEKLKASLLWQVYYFLISFLSVIIGFYLFKDIKITLYFYSFGMISVYILQLLLNYKYSIKVIW